MRLKDIRVERFRNILDSGSVPIDGAITCLVGKNESGKTNLLQALHTLNPALGDRQIDEDQYPRWLQKTDQRSGKYAEAVPISATFELDLADEDEIKGIYGDGVLRSTEWTCSRKYDGQLYWTVEVDERAACKAFEERHGLSSLPHDLPSLKARLTSFAQTTEPDAAGVEQPSGLAVKATTAKASADFLYPGDQVAGAVGGSLAKLMPKFFYFDSYSEMKGRTEIAPLINALITETESTLPAAQRTALALLRLGFAGTKLVDPSYEKRSGEMEAVAADLTAQVRRFWRQNQDLRLVIDIEAAPEVRADGQHIVNQFLQLRVLDERHFFTNNLDARSSGFRWFVSFLAAFKDFHSDSSVIVLLDEPALSLHARAQADFLSFIEETLGARHQVIYTTHSPFMVDAGHLERVRVVEDHGPDDGVTVKTQLMSRDPDTLSPIQGALGYDIAQNIFVGPDNLVVEGLSDYTYLTILSETLRAAGRATLDPRWRVLPAGGAGSMPAAVSLLGRELDVTVVADGGSKPPQKLNDLVTAGLLEQQRIITLGGIAGMRLADIEDLFEVRDFLTIYNAALGQHLTTTDLGAEDDRIIARIERHAGKFNHNDPATWLLANRATATAGLGAITLDRFEALFHAINSTLRPRA